MTFREILVRRGVSIRAHAVDPDEIYLCCPFCVGRGETPDERYRLGVNVVKGVGHCFNCGWKNRRALVALLRYWKMEPELELEPSTTKAPQPMEEVELPEDFQCLAQVYSDLDRLARRYLLRRGVTKAQIAEKRIGTSFIGRYAYRVIFPVVYKGILEGFVTRDFTGLQEPRYLNQFGEKTLYNLGAGHGRGRPRVVLSEGVFKALRIEQVAKGFVSAALLGHDLTERQLTQIQQAGAKEIVLWPDPDMAGRRGAVRVAETLIKAGFLVGMVWPVPGPADDIPLVDLERAWQHVECYSRGLGNRALLLTKDSIY